MDDRKIRKRQKTSIGAQFPESSHEAGIADAEHPLPNDARVTCVRCGVEKHGWTGNEGDGYWLGSQIYCCEGCAKNLGCDCIDEAERHTELNLAKSETHLLPPKPLS